MGSSSNRYAPRLPQQETKPSTKQLAPTDPILGPENLLTTGFAQKGLPSKSTMVGNYHGSCEDLEPKHVARWWKSQAWHGWCSMHEWANCIDSWAATNHTHNFFHVRTADHVCYRSWGDQHQRPPRTTVRQRGRQHRFWLMPRCQRGLSRAPLKAPLKPFWNLKPFSSPSQAPFKPPSKPSPSSPPFETILKPLWRTPWSPSQAALKPSWSPLKPPWSPSQAPLKPFSSPLEALLKLPWSPLEAVSSPARLLQALLKPPSNPLEARPSPSQRALLCKNFCATTSVPCNNGCVRWCKWCSWGTWLVGDVCHVDEVDLCGRCRESESIILCRRTW